jgi:hypothetical protein
MAYARDYCTNGESTNELLEDVHTPNKPRVDIAMKHMPFFAKAFGCALGTEYAPLNRCSLWGELQDMDNIWKSSVAYLFLAFMAVALDILTDVIELMKIIISYLIS